MVLDVVVDESGYVVETEVLRAPRPEVGLSAEAIRAVSLWTYEPGTLGGRPVSVRMKVIVEFSLN